MRQSKPPRTESQEIPDQERTAAGRKKLCLRTEKELRAYMHPLRQKILRCLFLEPSGMTAKQLADCLHVAPSSAGHHLAALEKVGLVELSHTEKIHGLTAKYYRAAAVDVCLKETEPAAGRMRDALVRTSMNELEEHFFNMVRETEKKSQELDPEKGDAMFGVIYLRQEEITQLRRRLADFLSEHSMPSEGTVPCEYGLIFCQAENGWKKGEKR